MRSDNARKRREFLGRDWRELEVWRWQFEERKIGGSLPALGQAGGSIQGIEGRPHRKGNRDGRQSGYSEVFLRERCCRWKLMSPTEPNQEVELATTRRSASVGAPRQKIQAESRCALIISASLVAFRASILY